MSTAAEVSSAVAEEFNTAFHDRQARVRDRAHAVLMGLLGRCVREGATFGPEHLVAGVLAAVEKVQRSPETNPVAYAFGAARLRHLKATEDAALAEVETVRKQPLIPAGVPVVHVMGAPLPAPPRGHGGFENAVESAIAESGITKAQADTVRGVMLMVANGWRAMPSQGIRGIAAGLCDRIGEKSFNAYGYVTEQIAELEAQGIVCEAPTSDRFMQVVEEYTTHQRLMPVLARARFLDAVRILLDSHQFFTVGEERVPYYLRQLGTGFVKNVWGRWASEVADAVRANQANEADLPITNPYKMLAQATFAEAVANYRPKESRAA